MARHHTAAFLLTACAFSTSATECVDHSPLCADLQADCATDWVRKKCANTCEHSCQLTPPPGIANNSDTSDNVRPASEATALELGGGLVMTVVWPMNGTTLNMRHVDVLVLLSCVGDEEQCLAQVDAADAELCAAASAGSSRCARLNSDSLKFVPIEDTIGGGRRNGAVFSAGSFLSSEIGAASDPIHASLRLPAHHALPVVSPSIRRVACGLTVL